MRFIVNKALKNAELVTDPFRLKQIINNLLGNAFKFTDSGSIEIGYILEEQQFKFFVKDSGIGIDKQKQDQIFKPFVQADNCFSRSYGGSGLGLAITCGLLKRMGGNVWVESDKGKGSTFYFTLPLKPVISQKTALQVSKHQPAVLN